MLPNILAGLRSDDCVLVMDADSQCSDQFVETALTALATTAGIGAVGGAFYGQPGHALIGQLQAPKECRWSYGVHRR